ncbi:unnamed protein product, partial [Sphacelaria rigidula]
NISTVLGQGVLMPPVTLRFQHIRCTQVPLPATWVPTAENIRYSTVPETLSWVPYLDRYHALGTFAKISYHFDSSSLPLFVFICLPEYHHLHSPPPPPLLSLSLCLHPAAIPCSFLLR